MSVKSSALSVERSPNSTNSGPLAELDYSVLQQCMHCGMCLPTCPTYAETGKERNSPRGRISLMRAIADGELETTPTFAEEMSYCLGCLACTTACPAGVDYTNLLEHARAHVEQSGIVKTPKRDFVRWLTMKQLFMKPRLLRFAGRLLWIYQATGLQSLARSLRITRLLPASIRAAEPSTPTIQRRFSDSLIAEKETPSNCRSDFTPRSDTSRRVLLLTGCVQDIAFSDINRATADVLLANNCEVHTPRTQSCCGSLHAHNGELELAATLARRQLDAVDLSRYDAIISNAAGCGSHLKHYDRLLANDPVYSARAAEWSLKLRDISEYLVEINFRHPRPASQPASQSNSVSEPNHPVNILRSAVNAGRSSSASSATTPITYHEACHLCHGQKISAQPRAILRAIPGLELRECNEPTWCCGSAGIYSITQPKTAAWLRDRKLNNLRKTDAPIVAVANPGCTLHLQAGEANAAQPLQFVHPIVLLARAYAAEKS
ncbi:MAG: heterodisulfide reductase-related iron-sulfur binding cluster [Nibricoccus sp.]